MAEVKEAPSRGKIVPITLDRLPYGEEGSVKAAKIGKTALPEGVSHREMYGDIVKIAWPSFVELVLTQLTSMADQIMVGQLAGSKGVAALAAVGLATQPKFLLMTMIQAMNIGSTAMVARFRGQLNQAKANQVLKQALLLNAVMSTFFMVVGLTCGEWMINFLGGGNISAETLGYAATYLRIQMYGFVPLCIAFTCTATLRGIGDTRTPMIYNTLANVFNLFFNYCLIYGHFGFPEMDVAGASLATVIGQMVAFVMASATILSKKRYIYFSFKEKFNYDKVIMGDVVNIGIPSMIEQLFMRAGMIIFTRAVTGLGDTMYATHQVCLNIQQMSFMTGNAFANASTTLMGQSLGKRRQDMANLYSSHTRQLGLITAVFFGLVLALFGRNIVGIYNDTQEIIDTGGKVLLMVAFMQPFQNSTFILAGALRGAGDTRFPALVTFFSVFIVRSVFSVLLVTYLGFGLWGAWIALILDQLLRFVLISMRYRSGKWVSIRINASAAPKQEKA